MSGTIPKKFKEALKEVYKIKNTDFKPQDGTTWELFLEDETSYKKGVNTACFAATLTSLTKCLSDNKNPKKMTYYMHETTKPEVEILPMKIRREWILLLKRKGIITDKTSITELLTEGISFDLSKNNLSPAGLYLQLSLCRYINEEPAVVTAVLVLVKAGVNFTQALAYSQGKLGRIQCHLVLPITGGMYGGKWIHKLGDILALNSFIKDRAFMDERNFMDNANNGNASHCWKFFTQLAEKKKNISLKEEKDIFSNSVSELFNCENSEIMDKVKLSKEKGEKVFV